ncbi:hypothetical protein T10_12515 [Trichinella papuae]|uniref:Uncharacterized protein n=1 Tax=Trichinella papuae TaxID=268474 RepID=A0A0V1MJ70_9BILA|nr:hypothetical protein T10_12515 [Trichinella papuae]
MFNKNNCCIKSACYIHLFAKEHTKELFNLKCATLTEVFALAFSSTLPNWPDISWFVCFLIGPSGMVRKVSRLIYSSQPFPRRRGCRCSHPRLTTLGCNCAGKMDSRPDAKTVAQTNLPRLFLTSPQTAVEAQTLNKSQLVWRSVESPWQTAWRTNEQLPSKQQSKKK